MSEKKMLTVRLSVVTVGGDLLVRATALNQKRQTYFNAPTDEQAIEGLKAEIKANEERHLFRVGYPQTVEVEL